MRKATTMRFGRTTIMGGVLVLAVAGSAELVGAYGTHRARDRVVRELSALDLPSYQHQKVVYHLATESGWLSRQHLTFLSTLQNHVAAVGAREVELRVVLQGPGIDLLRNASGNERLRTKIDALRAAGVRFLVCRNSMIDQGASPSELYGLRSADIVRAAVAELASLQGHGYVYLRP